jgi:hypothetical protein
LVLHTVLSSMARARASKCKTPQSKKKPAPERYRSPKTLEQKQANAERTTSKRREESADVWLMKERKKKENAPPGELDESVEYDGLVLAIDGDWLDFLKPYRMTHKSLFAPLMDSDHPFVVAIREGLKECANQTFSEDPELALAKKEVAYARTSFAGECFYVLIFYLVIYLLFCSVYMYSYRGEILNVLFICYDLSICSGHLGYRWKSKPEGHSSCECFAMERACLKNATLGGRGRNLEGSLEEAR